MNTYEVPEIILNLEQLVENWIETQAKGADPKGNIEKSIHEVLNDWEYQQLPYALRNKPFITSHKLQTYQKNPYFAHLLYNELVIPPVETEKNYFKIGQALDTLLTYGRKEYEKKFMMRPRSSKAEKDVAREQGITLLTASEDAQVEKCRAEYITRNFFPKRLVKTNIITIVNGMACKAELDHFDEDAPVFGDLKTVANLTAFFDGGWRRYKIQFGFYHMMAVLYMLKKLSPEDIETFRRELHGELYAVDKYSDFSRSHKFVFRPDTLNELHGDVERLIGKWKGSADSNIWPWSLDLSDESDLRIFMESPLYPLLDSFKEQIEPSFI